MGKKKPKKKPEIKAPNIQPPVKQEVHSKSRLRIVSVIAALLFIGLIGLIAYIFLQTRRTHPSTDTIYQKLSAIDFKGTESQVVQKIKSLVETTKQNPKSASAWGKLAMNLDIHDFRRESIPCYEQAASLDPKDFRWPYYAAIVHDEMGSPEALLFYKQSLELNPGYAATHLRYADALFQAKRLEEASREFNLALQANRNSSHAYLGLARIALTSGNLADARTNLEKAREVNPAHGEVHGLLAEVYRRLNMPEEARREIIVSQQLQKKKPLHDKLELELNAEGVSSYWYELRGRAYLDQGVHDAAIRELKIAVDASPDDPRLLTTLGVAYLHSKNYLEATKYFQAALALNPQSVNTMNNLATALNEVGKTDEAIQWLNKAMKQQPDYAASYDHLGRTFLREGKKAEAIEAFQLGHKNVPDDAGLALQLAWHLATAKETHLRDGTKAFLLADAICKKNNYQDPESLEVLAAAYAEEGNTEGASKVAQRALQIAELSGQRKLVGQIKKELKFYEAGAPFRE